MKINPRLLNKVINEIVKAWDQTIDLIETQHEGNTLHANEIMSTFQQILELYAEQMPNAAYEVRY